jgi:hypothetical protein
MDLKQGFQYGEELVEFTKEEIKKLKKIRDPSKLTTQCVYKQ